MKLGIGVVTFKMENRSVLNQIDLKHIVLETDSPYLAPVPLEEKERK
jgi:TatD DNase family protein